MSDIAVQPVLDLLAFAQERGLPVDPTAAGIDMSVRVRRVSWQVFVNILTQIEACDSDDALIKEFMDESMSGKHSWNMPNVLKFFVSARALYRFAFSFVGPMGFSNIRHTWSELSDGRFHIVLQIPEPFSDCQYYLRSARFAFRGVPRLAGMAPSEVEAEVTPRRGEYWITLPPSRTLIHQLLRPWRNFAARFVATRTLHEQTSALTERYRELARSEQALREERAILAQTVAERTHELEQANRELRAQIDERRDTERALRASQAQLASLFASIPVVVFLCDTEQRLLALNEHAFRYGLDVETVLGKSIAEILPESSAASLIAMHQRVIESRLPVHAELCLEMPVGAGWHLVSLSPVYDAEDVIIAVAGCSLDISKRKRDEEELRKAKDEADAASRAKTAFIATISHELRTPMAAILGYADILRRPGITDNERLAYAETVQRNGKRMIELIEDLLDIAKIEAGRFHVARSDCLLSYEVMEVRSLLELQAKHKNLTLDVEIEVAVPEVIRTDPKRLRQILVNVIGNAIKFTDHGGIRVRVWREGCFVNFSVSDTGMGIDPALGDRLFQPFSQIDESTTRRYEGTGLGLYLSRQLARALGGDLVLTESALGHGCTFIATIALEPPLLPATGEATTVQTTHANLSRLRVLIIEDAADVRTLFQLLLTTAGAKIALAPDGVEGLRVALSGNIDLVVLDLHLPGLDGFQIATKLRQGGFIKPIIGVSADEAGRPRALAAGCNEFFAKPVDAMVLVDAINRLGRVAG